MIFSDKKKQNRQPHTLRLKLIIIPFIIVLTISSFNLIFSSEDERMGGERWEQISVRGEYLLENNVWGDEWSTQQIFTSGGLVGWFWSKRLPSSNPVYPEIIYGKKPWLGKSTIDKLPVQLSEISNLTIELDYETVVDKYSWYNAMIDVWITKTQSASHNQISDELMIVLEGNKPVCGEGEIIEIDGRTYVYAAHKGEWRIHQFILCEGEKPKKINLIPFLKHANIYPGYYVASIEFGNEVWMGSGITVIKHINITVMKNDLRI